MIDASSAQFTAMLLLEQPLAVTYAALAKEVARIAPTARLGDWSGPIDDPSKATGIEMLSLDGQQMAVLAVDAPAPAIALDFGPIPNLLWPDPSKAIAKHRAHVMIVSPGEPKDRTDAVAKARAVTIIAAAYAALAKTIGVVWVDAANLVSPGAFSNAAEKVGVPGGLAVPFWVRVKFAPTATQTGGARTFVVGTAGLSAFGHPELEYAPSQSPLELASHALATAQYLLSSGASLKGGDTIGVEGQKRFNLRDADPGTFANGPVLVLEAA